MSQNATPKHAQDVRQLEEHDRLAVAERAADDLEEVCRIGDVLECVPADDGVAGEVGVALGVEVANKPDPVRGGAHVRSGR